MSNSWPASVVTSSFQDARHRPVSALGVHDLTGPFIRPSTRSAMADLMRVENEHRTANLLQLVCSNLERCARRVSDESARQAIEHAAEQMTDVGRLLRSLGSTDPSCPEDVQARLSAICDALDHLLLRPAGHSLTFRAEAQVSGLRTPPAISRRLALIATEFVVNAAKHAFVAKAAGRVTVSLGRTQDFLVCTVRDDGAGAMPAIGRRSSQGLILAEALAEEAGGYCRWLFTDRGTLAEASLPLAAPAGSLQIPEAPTRPPFWSWLFQLPIKLRPHCAERVCNV